MQFYSPDTGYTVRSNYNILCITKTRADSLFQLTFKNGFAVCDVTCTADYSTDKVVVNVTLYKGWDVVGAWTDQGKGSASITEQVKAVKGAEYTMSITWSVAGQWQRSETIRKTYTG